MADLPVVPPPLNSIQAARKAGDPYSAHRACDQCNLFRTCRSPFQRSRGGTGKIRVMLVGESPGAEDDVLGKLFSGKAGQMLSNQLRILGIPESEVWYSSAVICRPPNNKLDNAPAALASCKGGILAEIQAVDPDIVVLFGNGALSAVLGLNKITTWVGKVLWSDRVHEYQGEEGLYPDGRIRAYLPAIPPAWAMSRKPDFVRGFNESMAKLRRLYRGEVPRTNPEPPVKVLDPGPQPVKPVHPGPAPRLLPEIEDRLKADQEPSNYLLSCVQAHDRQLEAHQRAVKAYERAAANFENECKEWRRRRNRLFRRAIRYLKALRCRPISAYDYETTGLDPYQPDAKIYCVSFAPLKLRTERHRKDLFGSDTPWLMPSFGVSIPLWHDATPWTKEQLEALREAFVEWLTDPACRKLAQNARFEYTWSAICIGVEPVGHLEDTMTMYNCVDENAPSHGLKQMAEKMTPFGGYERKKDIALKKLKGNWRALSIDDLCPYNAADSYVTAYIKLVLWYRILEEQQEWVLENILDPATRLLSRMEMDGIQIAVETACQMDNEFARRIDEIDLEIAGMEEVTMASNLIYGTKAEKSTVADREEAYDMARSYLLQLNDEFKAMRDDPAAHQKPKGGRITPIELKVREIERTGERVERLRVQFEKAVTKISEDSAFNPGSDDHKRVLLYDVMQLKVIKMTEGGKDGENRKPSVDDEVLEHYKRYNVCRRLKERGKLKKLRGTYLAKLLPGTDKSALLVKPDGKLHPNVSPIGARTGRLSSGSKGRGKSDEAADDFSFNSQNTPRPFQWGCAHHNPWPQATCDDCVASPYVALRRCFQTQYICAAHQPTAQDGCTDCGRIIARDYAQLEFMIAGIVAQDQQVLACIDRQTEVENLRNEKEALEARMAKLRDNTLAPRIVELDAEIKAKAPYADIHKISASGAYGITPPEVTKLQRQNVKSAVSFGLLYRRGAPELAKDLGWSLARAQAFKAGFFENYWGIDKWLDETLEFAHKWGYVLAPSGRKRRLEDINSPNDKDRSHAENAAVNFPIQSWASDCTLLSAIEIDQIFRDLNMKARVISLVHDAIYVDCPYREIERVKRIMKATMEAVPKAFEFMTHPIRSDCKVSVTMAEADE